ncbi:MAG: phosphopantothenoylcysteine decarboxylase [Bdellovibrionales bacterium]
MKILITSGATREPIDQVRFITNMSTGKTGASLAEKLARQGHKVTYLHGQGAHIPDGAAETVEYSTFSDLDQKLQSLLSKTTFDLVLHAAAVSDFSVASVRSSKSNIELDAHSKINSAEKLQVELKPNFKILNQIKDYSQERHPLVIGFKLTFTESEGEQQEAIKRLFDGGSVDYVIHNDLKDMREKNRHIFRIHNESEFLSVADSVETLANKISEIAEARI